MKIHIEVIDDTGLPTQAAAAVQLLVHLTELIRCMKALGLTREQAVERAGAMIGVAWDEQEKEGAGADLR
ncbi:hypothetical protein [Roseomonas xinghualingensis]|uniref:hypothetical protein n=1 Tax=Roseomonas xinghualingensis TaxID=2986475 RepID=UPI0021F15468|nr:hypothetical protein [Roseomonas sp. SXEYE001]MCV4206882.1 hypothetical protein [Roseomonas sp. SXEYE001]